MRLALGAAALAGLSLASTLVALAGFTAVLRALASAGYGLVVASLLHLWTVLFCALAWATLIPAPRRPSLWWLAVFRWIREGVNNLLPAAQLGGVFVQARLLTFCGVSGDVAGAAAVVDLTLEVIALLGFALAGLGLLAAAEGDARPATPVVFGFALGLAAIAGFVAAQRLGIFKLLARFAKRLARRSGWHSPDALAGLHDAVQTLYGEHRRLIVGAGLHLAAWFLSVAEIWVLLAFMGVSAGLGHAAILASLGYAARSLGFFVPGALGVQEGGFALLAALIGLPATVGLALSLARRVREILLGVPALLVWQLLEGRRLWRAGRE